MRHDQADTVRNERVNSLSSSSRPVMIIPLNRVEKSTAETTARWNPSVANPQYFKEVLSAERNLLHHHLPKEASREKSPASRLCSGGFPCFARCVLSWAKYDRHVRAEVPHYDISSNGEGQPDEAELNGDIVHRGQGHWGRWKVGPVWSIHHRLWCRRIVREYCRMAETLEWFLERAAIRGSGW